MKFLVCLDGAKQDQRVLEEALKIAQGCRTDKVLFIHVYSPPISSFNWIGHETYPTQEQIESFSEQIFELEKKEREKREEMLSEAMEKFRNAGLETEAFIETGHPSETITRVASEQEVDTIVIGSRGLGGVKAMLLGSVSNAVAQQANSNVLIVK